MLINGVLTLLKCEAQAAISLNPNLTWAEVIVTDDKKNGNNMRIPKEEFGNIVKTGIYSPLKLGVEPAGHQEAIGKPIGVFTSFSEVEKEGSTELHGLVALWPKEREEAVATLTEMLKDGNSPQVSWEVEYLNEDSDEDGAKVLRNVVFNGAAVVAQPAYGGRTPIVAIAEIEESEMEVSAEVEDLKKEIQALKEENDVLKQFQNEVKAQAEKIAKLELIKEKFASLNKPEEFFVENEETLLAYSESQIDFMVQQMLAFKPVQANSEIKVPAIQVTKPVTNPRELGQAYRKLFK